MCIGKVEFVCTFLSFFSRRVGAFDCVVFVEVVCVITAQGEGGVCKFL